MVFKTWEQDFLNSWVLRQELGKTVGVSAVDLHSGLKSSETSKSEITIKWRRVGTEGFGSIVDFIIDFLIVGNNSTHDDI